jgi:hypothetical protein
MAARAQLEQMRRALPAGHPGAGFGEQGPAPGTSPQGSPGRQHGPYL